MQCRERVTITFDRLFKSERDRDLEADTQARNHTYMLLSSAVSQTFPASFEPSTFVVEYAPIVTERHYAARLLPGAALRDIVADCQESAAIEYGKELWGPLSVLSQRYLGSFLEPNTPPDQQWSVWLLEIDLDHATTNKIVLVDGSDDEEEACASY